MEILRLGYPKTKRKVEEVKLKSPIFVELSFESFVSRLSEEELERTYKDELIKLVETHKDVIARFMNMLEVELGEWDFGIEAKKGITVEKEKTKDFWEIYNYVPSGFAQLVAEGHWEHKV